MPKSFQTNRRIEMKVVKCKPYIRFIPKEVNCDCYYRGQHYKPFAIYEVVDFKWKKELSDYVLPIKEYLYGKLWYVWRYFYMKDLNKIANTINKIRDKLDPIPF